jgi:uncharacterized protein (TIGR02145 family)
MKRILFPFVGLLFLFSCEYQDNGVTSIDDVITSDYLLDGNLDSYVQNTQIVRLTGKPGVKTVSIGSSDLSNYEPCFVLYVATGTTPSTTVSSAIIKLDDMVVLNTSDFSKNAGQYQFEVCNLTQISVLTVEVRGEPDSYVNVWIEGKLLLKDCDGNIYKTVKIGNQVWMAENLKTTKYNDCTPIPLVLDGNAWTYRNVPGYCWYNNDPSTYKTYGALYNWYTVSNGKLCPTGWHEPTNADWTTLFTYLGGEDVAGGKIKESGTTHWLSPNTGGTNEYGFTAIAAGARDYLGNFCDMGIREYWWTTDEFNIAHAYPVWVQYDIINVVRWFGSKSNGMYVRCIQD